MFNTRRVQTIPPRLWMQTSSKFSSRQSLPFSLTTSTWSRARITGAQKKLFTFLTTCHGSFPKEACQSDAVVVLNFFYPPPPSRLLSSALSLYLSVLVSADCVAGCRETISFGATLLHAHSRCGAMCAAERRSGSFLTKTTQTMSSTRPWSMRCLLSSLGGTHSLTHSLSLGHPSLLHFPLDVLLRLALLVWP
jgi:hypothetical protein